MYVIQILQNFINTTYCCLELDNNILVKKLCDDIFNVSVTDNVSEKYELISSECSLIYNFFFDFLEAEL